MFAEDVCNAMYIWTTLHYTLSVKFGSTTVTTKRVVYVENCTVPFFLFNFKDYRC